MLCLKREEIRYRWKQVYSYIVPTLITISYIIYLYAIYYYKKAFPLMQNSRNFGSMLEALVTFMSIILSVFGFLIPSFLSSKGTSSAIKYFMKYADMRVFSAKLKNIVGIGLVDTFFTCILFLKDIFSESVANVLICIWLWFLLFFMCNSYRFISIMINLLLAEKEEFMQKVADEVSDEERQQLNSAIRKI